MNTDQTTDVASKIKELEDRAKETGQRIAETNKESREQMDALEAQIDESIEKVEKGFTDLDAIEKQAGDELDTHILQQAEDLARE